MPIGFLLGIAVGVTGSVVWTLNLQLTAPAIFENNYSWGPSSSSESTALARRESLGFFQDVPDSVWKRYKERFQFTQPNYNERSVKNDAKISNRFWGEHFEPEFTCPFEFRLGKLGDTVDFALLPAAVDEQMLAMQSELRFWWGAREYGEYFVLLK